MSLIPIRFNEGLNNDSDFLHSALEQIRTLQRYHTFSASTRLLDYGCGQGRLAFGLISDGVEMGGYLGLDTHEESIKWCQEQIQSKHPKFQFVHVSAHNQRYNPTGEYEPTLPLNSEEFDIAFLNSVFSHMLASDVAHYLPQMNNTLKSGGILYLTAFVEKNVPDVEENPKDYLNKPTSGPLHRVRYEEGFFLGMIQTAGFKILDFQHQGIERTQQSVVIAEKA
jgi:SAM-dependent methyltransferase